MPEYKIERLVIGGTLINLKVPEYIHKQLVAASNKFGCKVATLIRAIMYKREGVEFPNEAMLLKEITKQAPTRKVNNSSDRMLSLSTPIMKALKEEYPLKSPK